MDPLLEEVGGRVGAGEWRSDGLAGLEEGCVVFIAGLFQNFIVSV